MNSTNFFKKTILYDKSPVNFPCHELVTNFIGNHRETAHNMKK